jgi:hypothetical protein
LSNILETAVLAMALLPAASMASPDTTPRLLTPSEKFESIRSWEGRWQVAETTALHIVFEATARGSAIVERRETSAGLHSMTIYHMDGEAVIATHYCPQGNQPRLESRDAASGEVRFALRDVTDLDAGETHAHALWFTPEADGTLKRSEVYRGEDGLQPPSVYTLTRSAASR